MSASNLGIVFGPTLLRPSEGAASLSSLMDTAHQAKIVELLISHCQVAITLYQAPSPLSLPKMSIPSKTLLRPSEGAASLSSLMDTAHQAKIVELLISHCQVTIPLPIP